MRMTQPHIMVPHHHRIDMTDVFGEMAQDWNREFTEKRRAGFRQHRGQQAPCTVVPHEVRFGQGGGFLNGNDEVFRCYAFHVLVRR